MNQLPVKIKYLSPLIGAQVDAPAYATTGSAGLDLCACIEAPYLLNPGERFAVPLGIALEIPEGYAGFIYARSGLGVRYGVTLPNCVGVIDSDYRGEIKCAITNHSDKPYEILPGERICQMVISPVFQAELIQTQVLDETERGSGGFGSTGRR